MPFLYILIAVLVITVIFLICYYFWKSVQFRKQAYGKKAVEKMMKAFARPRKYKVFSNVTFSCNGTAVTIENVLLGDFGLLFVSSIQGNGSFYGDYAESRWSFKDGNQKIYFKNPVDELNRKIELFRTVLAQHKIYNVPVDSAIVIVSFAKETQLYLNNDTAKTPVLTSVSFPGFLRSPHFETQCDMDQQAVADLLSQLSK